MQLPWQNCAFTLTDSFSFSRIVSWLPGSNCFILSLFILVSATTLDFGLHSSLFRHLLLFLHFKWNWESCFKCLWLAGTIKILMCIKWVQVLLLRACFEKGQDAQLWYQFGYSLNHNSHFPWSVSHFLTIYTRVYVKIVYVIESLPINLLTTASSAFALGASIIYSSCGKPIIKFIIKSETLEM